MRIYHDGDSYSCTDRGGFNPRLVMGKDALPLRRSDVARAGARPTGLLLYYSCTATILLLYYYYTTTILSLYYYYTTTMLLLFYYWTATRLLLDYYSTIIRIHRVYY